MYRSSALALLFFLLAACSTTAPQTEKGEVRSGEETAKAAADAARKAEESGNTGVLIESSDPEKTEEEGTGEEQTDPAPTVLRIELVRGTPTMNGEPIPRNRLSDVIRDAVEANPEILVVFVRDSMTGPEATAAFMRQARAAGAQRVEERPALP